MAAIQRATRGIGRRTQGNNYRAIAHPPVPSSSSSSSSSPPYRRGDFISAADCCAVAIRVLRAMTTRRSTRKRVVVALDTNEQTEADADFWGQDAFADDGEDEEFDENALSDAGEVSAYRVRLCTGTAPRFFPL
eukprot:IDg5549t1